MPLKLPKFFYGYWILVATFICLLVMSGCNYWAFSLFVKPLQSDLGWSRGTIMAAFTIFLLVTGVTSPFIGRIIDRYGAKKAIFIGALVSGLALASLGLLNDSWHFYLAYAVIGIGQAAMGPVAQSSIVSNWFKKKRGFAIGVMSTGIGAGGFTLAPIIGGYLIPNLGWELSYIVLAIITWALVIPLALFVIKTKPAEMGLYPDGLAIPETTKSNKNLNPATEGLTLRMALATSAFWLIAVSFLTTAFSQVGVTQSQVNHLGDIGFSTTLAATIHGFVGLVSGIGKFGFGWLCDRIAPKYAAALGHSLIAAGILILVNLKPTSPSILIWLYVIIFGMGLGAWLPTMSILTSTNFGLVSYGAIFGMMTLAQSIGASIGPLIAGTIYDTAQSYHSVFIIFLALYAIAIPTMLLVRRPKALSLYNLKGK